MMYKIGLTYKRQEIFANDLREEFKKNTTLTLGSLRKDLEHVNEGISQVHDEMETSQLANKKLQLKTEKDVKLLVKSNEMMLLQAQ